MFEVRETDEYADWFKGLRDVRAKAKIVTRIRRASQGNFGDAEAVGEGVSELKIDYGPGYRVYYLKRGNILILLLHGGDKDSQRRDVALAKKIARQLKG